MNALEKVSNLRHKAEEKIRAIQADKDLTADAKARRIAEIRGKTNPEVAKQRTAHGAEAAERRASLQRRLFGLSFKLAATESDKELARMSYRDALAKSDGIASPDDALKALERAGRTGDAMMTRAILCVAHERGWNSVLESHAHTNESFSEGLQELQGLERRAANRQIQFSESMAFSNIRETTEEIQARMVPASADSSKVA